ncbi:MAG: hypothetical protein AB1714_11220 [Acidobacteriota bacterium]
MGPTAKDDRKFDLNRIPAELRGLQRWVLWKLEERDGRPAKMPYHFARGRLLPASSTDPATWSDFETAIKAGRKSRADGVGFVFDLRDGYTGVDLDKCRDPETGTLEPWAADIIKRLDSYAEASQSRAGVHIIVRGKLPEGGRRNGKIEMYDAARYFCMTGWVLDGHDTIEDRQAELEELHREIFEKKDDGSGDAPPTTALAPKTLGGADLTDDEVIERASRAANGAKFSTLWRGDTAGYPSQSEADLALCSILAWWCSGDSARVDRIFRRSRLMRPKWDERHGGRTYGETTIETAITGCMEHSPGLGGIWRHTPAPSARSIASPVPQPSARRIRNLR